MFTVRTDTKGYFMGVGLLFAPLVVAAGAIVFFQLCRRDKYHRRIQTGSGYRAGSLVRVVRVLPSQSSGATPP